MSGKICFGIFFMNFIGAVLEGRLLEKNMNSLIILSITASIMILTMISMGAINRGEKRLKFKN